MSHPDRVEYEILEDGTCSYCNRDADWIELPDGTLERSDSCYYCDRYNEELLTEEDDTDTYLYYG